MGSDCNYYCDRADRESAEAFLSVVKRWADDTPCPYQQVEMRNCSLEQTREWEWPYRPEVEIGIVELYGMKLTCTPEELEEDFKSDVWYMWRVRERVDLYGLRLVDNRWGNVLQFIFDFAADGRMVSLELENEADFEALDKRVPCRRLQIGGCWRSGRPNYDLLPRFLALCKARYLPHLGADSDYGEWRHYRKQFWEDEPVRKKIQEMDEDGFYEEYVKGCSIVG